MQLAGLLFSGVCRRIGGFEVGFATSGKRRAAERHDEEQPA